MSEFSGHQLPEGFNYWVDTSWTGIEFTVIITVPPELAGRWLERNTNNRPLSPPSIAQIASDLTASKYGLNGQPIIWGRSGVLLDGQDRLTAIIESGVSMRTMVCFGVDDALWDTIDTNRKRTSFHAMAKAKEPNASVLTGAVNTAMRYRWGTLRFSGGGGHTVRPHDTAATLLEFPTIRESVAYVNHPRPRALSVPFGHVAFAHFMMTREAGREKADLFIDSLYQGANLSIGDPVYMLREMMQDRTKSMAKVRAETVLAWVINAWNIYKRGGQVRNRGPISWGPHQPYPRFEGLPL